MQRNDEAQRQAPQHNEMNVAKSCVGVKPVCQTECHEDLNGRVRPDSGTDRSQWSDLPRLSQLTVMSLRAT